MCTNYSANIHQLKPVSKIQKGTTTRRRRSRLQATESLERALHGMPVVDNR